MVMSFEQSSQQHWKNLRIMVILVVIHAKLDVFFILSITSVKKVHYLRNQLFSILLSGFCFSPFNVSRPLSCIKHMLILAYCIAL